MASNDGEVFRQQARNVGAKGDGVAANVDAEDGQRETKCGEEAACTGTGTPETVEDCVEQVPLVPVGLAEFALDCGGGADAEEEDEGFAGEDGRCLAPAGVFGSFGVACEVRLLVEIRSCDGG